MRERLTKQMIGDSAYSGAVEVRPFQAKTKLLASEAEGLPVEAMKGEPDDDGNP